MAHDLVPMEVELNERFLGNLGSSFPVKHDQRQRADKIGRVLPYEVLERRVKHGNPFFTPLPVWQRICRWWEPRLSLL